MESYEFEWRLRPKNPIVKPCFRMKFLDIFTLNGAHGAHPTHTIGYIVNSITPSVFATLPSFNLNHSKHNHQNQHI